MSQQVDEFRDKIRKDLERRQRELESKHGHFLNELRGLSPEALQSVTPNFQSDYESLIKVVEDASRRNIGRAELAKKIRELGITALEIAKLTALGKFLS